MGRYAGVIARRDRAVVLVRGQYERWHREYWSLPSGAVETGEPPAAGASRELAEETGLVVPANALVPISRVAVTDGATTTSRSWNFTVECESGDLAPNDPDGDIIEARWFPVEQAVQLLEQLPYPPIREPAVTYLRGEAAPDAEWTFLWHDDQLPPDQFSWAAPS